MRILINGANGRMGQMLAQCIETAGHTIAGRISPSYTLDAEAGTYPTPESFNGGADVLVDFSNHAATAGLMNYCVNRKLPAVVATTGQTAEEMECIRTAAQSIPLFLSANMSIGIALLAEMAKKAAAMFPDADIEIIERHHNQKLDVPSGTALLLARRMQEVCTDSELLIGRRDHGKRGREIGIHSLRYGTEVGTHEILIAANGETMTLKHEAENRGLFAQGALAAAAFLIDKGPGLYDMRDIVA